MSVLEMTGVDSLIDSAFNEFECIAPTRTIDHGGGMYAWWDHHDPHEKGFVCEAHHHHYLGQIQKALTLARGLLCAECGHTATTVDQWVKIYVL